MDNVRGEIRNREFATQVRNFSGLRYGNITPTDIDGMIEYKNKLYIFIETKFGNAELPFGQRLAFERLCDDLQKVKPTLLIIASHNSNGDIDVAKTTVTSYRYRGVWKTQNQQRSTGELIAWFIASIENKNGAE
jgi:hypothetical protein